MAIEVSTTRRIIPVCFVFFLTIIVFLILFSLRYADDNRLTSWEWTFSDVDILRIALFLLAGGAIAYILAKFRFPEERPALFLLFTSFAVSMVFWREIRNQLFHERMGQGYPCLDRPAARTVSLWARL
jgi:hypothetical protein